MGEMVATPVAQGCEKTLTAMVDGKMVATPVAQWCEKTLTARVDGGNGRHTVLLSKTEMGGAKLSRLSRPLLSSDNGREGRQ